MTMSEKAGQAGMSETDTSRLPVGDALRTQREQLGWTLPDVAAWLRIRLSYLDALESGQVSKLPGNAYALGFLRAYASALGLDAEDMSRRFRNETKEINRKPELTFPAPVPERGVPAGAMVLLGLVVVVGAYVGWYEFTGHERRLVHAVPPVPATLLPYAGGPAAASPQVATVMPGPGQTPSALPVPAASPAPRTVSSAAPAPGSSVPAAGVAAGVVAPGPTSEASNSDAPVTPSGSGSPATALSPGAAIAPPAPAASPAAPDTTASVATAGAPPVGGAGSPSDSASPAPTPPAPGQITLKAVATTWVQVRQVGGKVIYDHVMQPGESWPVPADAGAMTLTTGSAGGLTLSADGIVTPVLGRIGGIRRNIVLSAQTIHDGSVANAGPSSSGPATGPQAAPAHPQRPVHGTPHASSAPADPDGSADNLNAKQLGTDGAH